MDIFGMTRQDWDNLYNGLLANIADYHKLKQDIFIRCGKDVLDKVFTNNPLNHLKDK